MPKVHFQRPLLIKYLTGGAVISLLVCLMLAALYGAQAAQYRERLSTVHESGARKAAERALVRNARSLAAALSTGLAVPIHESNLPAVGQLLRRALANPDVEFVLVTDGQGRALHNGETPLDASAQSADAVLPEWCDTRGQGIALNLSGGLCVSDLVLAQHVVVGSVFVGLNSNSVEADVAEVATDANSVFDQLRTESLFGLMVLSLIGLMLGLTVSHVIASSLALPIERLAENARRVAGGERKVSFQLKREDEIGDLGGALETMKQALIQSATDLEAAANTDKLTSLPNRRGFTRAIQSKLAEAARNQTVMALLYLDLDDFKDINDSFGHDVGDEVLVKQAERLVQCLRPYDEVGHSSELEADELPAGSDISRFGGDEFVILLSGLESSGQAMVVAERLADLLGRPIELNGDEHRTGASIGIALFPNDGQNFGELMKCADMAMYAAKRGGGSRVAFYDSEISGEVERRVAIKNDLIKALERDELHLVYQPILNVETMTAASCEALLRWKHPIEGPIGPDVFLSVATDYGLMQSVTDWVLRRACADYEQTLGPGTPNLGLSINVPFADLDVRACVSMIEQLRTGPLKDVRVRVEITETSMIKNQKEVGWALEHLRSLGCEIWLDDFGTGYSSLSYLHTFPLDGIKIDRQFINGLSDRPEVFKLVRGIIRMATAMGLRVVAEGVETEVQLRVLSDLGCEAVQGFLFSPGVRPEQLAEVLQGQTVKVPSRQRDLRVIGNSGP